MAVKIKVSNRNITAKRRGRLARKKWVREGVSPVNPYRYGRLAWMYWEAGYWSAKE